jgi:hypothetical protein
VVEVESCQFVLSISQFALSRVTALALDLGGTLTDVSPKLKSQTGMKSRRGREVKLRLLGETFGSEQSPSRGQARQSDWLSKRLKTASIPYITALSMCLMPDASLSMDSLRRGSDGKQGRQTVLVCF